MFCPEKANRSNAFLKHVLLVVVADALVYIFGLQKRMEKIGESSPAINNILSLLSSLKLN